MYMYARHYHGTVWRVPVAVHAKYQRLVQAMMMYLSRPDVHYETHDSGGSKFLYLLGFVRHLRGQVAHCCHGSMPVMI